MALELAPMAAQVALALVIGEFGHYWWHRLGHEVPLLWRLHATHHSATRLYWLNANRFHWLDINAMYVFQILPLVALGMSQDAFLVYGIFTIIFGYLQSSNIDYRIGVLNYVLSSPQLHRWHHSQVLEEGNTNYAGDVMIWDHLFGTFFYPKHRKFESEIGNGMPSFPKGFVAQQLSPFRWKEIERASTTPNAPEPSKDARLAL